MTLSTNLQTEGGNTIPPSEAEGEELPNTAATTSMVEEDSLLTWQEMQQQLAAVKGKCGRLEAQAILVSVQQLDLLARGVAVALSAACLGYYWKLLLWCFFARDWAGAAQLYDRAASSESALSTILFFAECPVMLARLLLPPWLMAFLVSVVGIAGKACLLALPVLHHRRWHGMGHRRFEVFAVFFIVMIRMKLCRWRERVFAVDAAVDSTTTAAEQQQQATSGMSVAAPVAAIPPYGSVVTEDEIWDANYEISARFLYVSILRLQGLWTKSAQYLSSRADFMPVAYVRELQKLQDSAPQTPWNKVIKMIPEHVLEALTDLNETALASASIGQVHTATLRKTGEKVVVKVQHLQARSLLMDDFWSLQVFCRIVRWIEPEYAFIEVLMREWASEARKELDFLQEAENLKDAASSIAELMQGRKVLHTNATDLVESLPFQVEIPRPYDSLCTPDVLVMSFCEGARIDDMDRMKEWKLSPTAVMDGVAQTFAHMMYVTPPFNGDPHAGNLFVRPGTSLSESEGFTLVLLDWGLAKRMPEQKRKAFCQMACAAATFDFGLLLDAFKTIGLKMKRENVAEDMEGIRFMLREIVPREVSRNRIKAKIKTDVARRNSLKKGEKIPMESKAYPGEFFFFVRVNELLHGLGSKFGIQLTYVDILKPYAERGLSKFSPYSSESSASTALPPIVESKDVALMRKVSDVVRELKREGNIAGAQVCVLDSNGQSLLHIVDGHLGGLKKQIEMRPDALILGYSCTKAVAATLAHIMVTKGYLTYDERVCDSIWQAFCPSESPPPDLHVALDLPEADVKERWAWKRQVTLRHILTHSSGMWSALPAKLTIKSMASCEQCVASFQYDSAAPEDTILPESAPGSKTEYHFMSFGWLVAGALTGAYARKHRLDPKTFTFEQVYEAILLPRLSKETLENGFRPCGGGGDFPMAFTETEDISMSRVLQMQREAEAFGEKKEDAVISDAMKNIRESFRGKEFMLDQRIWNCEEGLQANCPAAGGRFSASGLAMFYHDLGSGKILDKATLESVSAVVACETLTNALQGQTVMTSANDKADANTGRSLGFGYQLIQFDSDAAEKPGAFGHAGVGGSIGFHHSDSGISVGVMLNKADGDKSTSTRIVQTIAKHFGW